MERRRKRTDKENFKSIICENNKKYVQNYHNIKCPYCSGKMIYKPSDQVFKNAKTFSMFYVCENYPECDCYIKANEKSCPVGEGNCKNCKECLDYKPLEEKAGTQKSFYDSELEAHDMPKCKLYNTCNRYVPLYRKMTKEDYLMLEPMRPIGKPANGQLRQLRGEAHYYFNMLEKLNIFSSQGQLYSWLSYALAIPIQETHIGFFDDYFCKRTIELSLEILFNNRSRFMNPITLYNSHNLKFRTYSESSEKIQQTIDDINSDVRRRRKF